MLRNISLRIIYFPAIAAACGLISKTCSATLYLYEPFNYAAGDNLGGTDPDGAGPTAGTPTGKSSNYGPTFGGSYTWYARGTVSNYQSPQDTVVSSGNLSYAGLATSQGNSVSYGSALSNPANDAFNKSLYADAIALPTSVTSGSLYASFIIRIKSEVEDGTATADRHSPAGFIRDLTNAGNAGGALDGASGSAVTAYGGNFWMRRDPVEPTLSTTNFSPGKSSGDGIGPGAAGDTAGWQHSSLGSNVENNQFGDLDGQPEAIFATPATWQTYFVVLKYQFDAQDPTATGQADTVSLWMNPGSGTLGTATGEADASQAASGNLGSYYAALNCVGTATGDVASINSFALVGHRQNTNNTFAVDFDELRIGTTWQDVTPTAAPSLLGDFNSDGKVDAGDYATWRKNKDTNNALANDNGLGTPVGLAHYNLWRANYGNPPGAGSGDGLSGDFGAAVPEPSTLLLAAVVFLAAPIARRRRSD